LKTWSIGLFKQQPLADRGEQEGSLLFNTLNRKANKLLASFKRIKMGLKNQQIKEIKLVISKFKMSSKN